MPDPQILSAPSQSLRESPALSEDAHTLQLVSGHNSELKCQAALQPQNVSRIFFGAIETPVASFPWLHDMSNRHRKTSPEAVSLKNCKKCGCLSLNHGMNTKISAIFLDLVERLAIEHFPLDKSGAKAPFNMTHFLLAAGLNPKSNNLKWARLRKNPENLSLVDASLFAHAVGKTFIDLVSRAYALAEEDSQPGYARAAEKKPPYGKKKAANHD